MTDRRKPRDEAPNVEPMPVSDPRAILGWAHPIRIALYYELAARGSARAVDLASAIGEPANSVSFHLRQLARYGYIERDYSRAIDKRERWWRPVSQRGHRFEMKNLEGTVEGRSATDALLSWAHVTAHRHIDQWFDLITTTGEPVPYTQNFDVTLRLTVEEMKAMGQEMGAVLGRWLDQGRDRESAGDTEGRQTFLWTGFAMPYDVRAGADRPEDPARP